MSNSNIFENNLLAHKFNKFVQMLLNINNSRLPLNSTELWRKYSLTKHGIFSWLTLDSELLRAHEIRQNLRKRERCFYVPHRDRTRPKCVFKKFNLTFITLQIVQHALISQKYSENHQEKIPRATYSTENWKMKVRSLFDAQMLTTFKALALKKLCSLYKRIAQPFPHLEIWQEKWIGPNTRPILFSS